MSQRPVHTSSRLAEVRYEIRGTLSHRARDLEAEGRQIVRLNIGNPGAFGFEVPAHIREAVTRSLPRSEAYCQQQGLLQARQTIAYQQVARGSTTATAERVFIGNGVSELIDLSLRALLEPGDEVLVPAPDYPLWTAATILNGGRAVHYPCPASRGHLPDADEIAALITPRTRAIVLINPNNPTGANYPRELLRAIVALAERHRIVLMADEIYDGILYDDATFQPLAPLAGDLPCISFGGLSKVHRACGYRVGWFTVSGADVRVQDMLRAFDLLAALRLCGNVPGQWAIQPALEGADTIRALTLPGGRLYESRKAVLDAVERSAFLDVVAPAGALYAFPGVHDDALPGLDDEAFALHLLESEDVLIVPGSSFNVAYRNHFRITLLPEAPVIADVFERIERALGRFAERARARHVA
ncbi:aminotransferase class I/II-fold pyridoxal phosphate-dependent enzyme [Dokdonella sp. MW10]|uniref:aminotransferase class I/II-fold pyridoxal phosphate-dependent enzyme n=1 Tax=Dokdonella sp. MW10 TaxID=2992926 RepID=UPI003F80F2AC